MAGKPHGPESYMLVLGQAHFSNHMKHWACGCELKSPTWPMSVVLAWVRATCFLYRAAESWVASRPSPWEENMFVPNIPRRRLKKRCCSNSRLSQIARRTGIPDHNWWMSTQEVTPPVYVEFSQELANCPTGKEVQQVLDREVPLSSFEKHGTQGESQKYSRQFELVCDNSNLRQNLKRDKELVGQL